jgi:cysteinyl-tRNA synthetase
VLEALADDLNTAQAMTELHRLSRDETASLRVALRFLGLMGEGVPVWAAAPGVDLSALEGRLAEARNRAMETKDFSAVDAMKAALLDAGIEVRMSKTGVALSAKPDFDPAKLEALK